MTNITKSPRLFTHAPLMVGGDISLNGAAHHYLKNVMRVSDGNALRLFNGRDGEFVAAIKSSNKKTIDVHIQSLLRPQILRNHKTALIFAPLKKERNDFLIEKAVELDVTDLYPITTQNTDVRKINHDRLLAQMIEAAEQCERMDIPVLHPIQTMAQCLNAWNAQTPLFAGIERHAAPILNAQKIDGDRALLIGPAGGFTDDEKNSLLTKKFVRPISLGDNILRAETAAIVGLSLLSR